MKARPILFNGAMVRAILSRTKTQTRRVVKPEGADHLFQFLGREGDDTPTGEWAWCSSSHVVSKHIRCPYGQPGDRLWVREAWRAILEVDHMPPRDLNPAHRIWYETDAPHQPGSGKLRPGMFMPRWASRILLELVSVRVERLQEISDFDAIDEGVIESAPHLRDLEPCMEWRYAYEDLWRSINGPASWDANPWVWVVEFKRVKP